MMNNYFLLAAVWAGACFAQPPATHVILAPQIERLPMPQDVSYLSKILPRLKAEGLGPVATDSAESRVLDAAKQAAERSLRLDFADLGTPAVYTFTQANGDVLVARWTATGLKRPERAVWLWDTPYETAFVMEIDGSGLQPKDLTEYTESLFAWDRFTVLKSIILKYLTSKPGAEQAVGFAKCLETERHIYWLRFNAAAIDGHAYILVLMPKSMFTYPPEVDGVPERFPPLQTRLGGVPRSDLFAELGKGYDGKQLLSYPRHRDVIILSELLSRAPVTGAEVREIIVGRFDDGKPASAEILLARLNALLMALAKRDQLAAYLPVLEQFFIETELPAGEWMKSTLASRFLGVMRKHHVDASPASLTFLKQGKFIRESLFDLEQNGRGRATLNELVKVEVPTELRQQKDLAVKGIQGRLAK
jgi:hypothetical protein